MPPSKVQRASYSWATPRAIAPSKPHRNEESKTHYALQDFSRNQAGVIIAHVAKV